MSKGDFDIDIEADTLLTDLILETRRAGATYSEASLRAHRALCRYINGLQYRIQDLVDKRDDEQRDLIERSVFSPWFPMCISPVHPGLYDIRNQGCFTREFWSGDQWLISTPRAASGEGDFAHRWALCSGAEWRGLAQEPKPASTDVFGRVVA